MFEKGFQKHITAKNIIFFVITILLLVFITKIKDIAILFFAAYVIACSLNPLADILEKKMKRSVASAIVILLALSLTTALFIPIIVLGGQEIKSLIDHFPAYIDNIKLFMTNTPIINNSHIAQMDMGAFISSASGFTSKFVNQSINASMNMAAAFIYIIAAVIIIYYFMADKKVIKDAYLKMFPSEMKDKAGSILDTISQKIGGYVIAQAATMTSVGIIMGFGLFICGIEYAFLLGLLTAILDIIPVIGPAIALLICLITTYKAGAVAMGLVVLVFAVAQLAENNLLRPYIFGKILNIHPLIIYLFIFITAQYLGLIGVVFAPAIAATVCVLVDELYIKSVN